MLEARSMKKIALIMVFIFAWINLAANFDYAQESQNPLSQAQELYQSERYDAAVQLLQKFIAQNSGLAGQKEKVANAYYLLAKIHYELREDKQMGDVLKSLFSLSPQYSQEENNEGFKKVVGEYRRNLVITTSGSGTTGTVEKQVKEPGKLVKKKKKKFPLLLVVGGIIIVGLVVYLLIKKPKYTLTVSKGDGVSGGPESGVYQYKKGTSVSYSYSTQNGYKHLWVMLDEKGVSTDGTILMDGNHSLMVGAEPKVSYSLNVTKGTGVAGTPVTGTYWWEEGQTASYSYSLQTDYKDLVVKLDNVIVASSGTIAMNGSHSLDVSATYDDPNVMYTLTVKWFNIFGHYVAGSPSEGTFYCKKGTIVNYNYYVGVGESIIVYIDYLEECVKGSSHNTSTCSGSVLMDKDRYMEVQAGPY